MKLTPYQLFCLLLILVGPVAYLETPHTLVHILYANSWLGVLTAIIPGLLLIQMYQSIIIKSRQPFPRMLDEHLGKTAGRIIAMLYIPIFIIVCSFTLRLFIEFMKMIVLPATPISVFIGVLLLVSLAAVKTGLINIARVIEMIVPIGFTFAIVIMIVALFNNYHPERLLPFGYINYWSLGQATAVTASVLGKLMPVLTLAYFLDKKQQAGSILRWVLLFFIPLVTISAVSVIITRGIMPALSMTFPTFATIRLARIGAFIQNLDIFFVAIWILGIFGAVTVPWFMACYVTQQVFGLKDYRLIAAPTALIIGYLSIIICRNNLEVVIWSQKVIPWVYSLFFIAIPFILFIITLFKPYPLEAESDPANPGAEAPPV